jgi:Secretion system C-terminal sorting domain
MRLIYITGVTVLLFLCTLGGHAQSILGFTNTAGFPTVVNPQAHYDLEGWIVNRGVAAFSGQLRVELLADSCTLLQIDNFNIAGLLQPGDSLYWSRNNYQFPPGHFRSNNNDVLIWPTAPSGGDVYSDSIGIVIYYTEGSAFRLSGTEFGFLAAGMDITRHFDLAGKAENLSARSNAGPVCLYAQIPGREARCIAQASDIFALNDVAVLDLHHFSVWQEFGLHSTDTVGGLIDRVEFFALETGLTVSPLNRISIPTIAGLVGNAAPSDAHGIAVYPNPFAQTLTVEVPQAWRADAQVQLIDLSGRTVLSQPLQSTQLSVAQLPSGSYILQVSSSKGVYHKQVICH